MKSRIPVQPSSGNVFADLGLPDADRLPLQAELTRLIYIRIRQLGLNQLQAGQRLGLRQPDVSKLMNGRHAGFSTERLFRLLNSLDQDVEIVIRQKPARAHRSGRISVVAA